MGPYPKAWVSTAGYTDTLETWEGLSGQARKLWGLPAPAPAP